VREGHAERRVAVRREVRRLVERLVGRAERRSACHSLAIGRGKPRPEVDGGVDVGEVPRGAKSTEVGTEVGKAILGEKSVGGDTGVSADEACRSSMSGRMC
jgi:hypothetical protein